jgi:hypothetical protein
LSPAPAPTYRLPDDPALEPSYWCECPASKPLLKTMSTAEVKRQEGIYELIQTERGYVRHMAILHHCFRAPVMEEGLLTPEQLCTLFADLDTMMTTNANLCRLLSQLRDSQPAVGAVGAVFLEGFRRIDQQAYAAFCSSQNAAAVFYREKRRTYALFNTCMAGCEAMAVCERLSLTDFIVKPLQRLTKYPLLLKVRVFDYAKIVAGFLQNHKIRIRSSV